MKHLAGLACATLPVAVVAALSWFGVFTFVNAYLVQGRGWSNQDWTLAMLFMTGGMFVWYPVCTEITSLIGRRGTVLLCMALPALAFMILAVSATPWVVYGCMALMGSATAAYLVAWMPLLAGAAGDRPGRAMGLAAFLLNLVTTVALLAGGQVVAAGNYRFALCVLSCACLASVAAAYPLARRLETWVAENRALAGGDPVERAGLSFRHLGKAELTEMLRSPLPYVILFGICAAPFSFQSLNALFPNLSRDIHGLSEPHIAGLVGIGRIPTLVSLFIISHFIDRLDTMRCYGIGLLLDATAVFALAWAPDVRVLAGCYMGFYFVHGTVWAAALPSVNAVVRPQLRDAAFALALMVEVGAIVLTGAVHNRLIAAGFSLPVVFTVCGTVTLVLAAALIVYSCRVRFQAASSAR